MSIDNYKFQFGGQLSIKTYRNLAFGFVYKAGVRYWDDITYKIYEKHVANNDYRRMKWEGIYEL